MIWKILNAWNQNYTSKKKKRKMRNCTFLSHWYIRHTLQVQLHFQFFVFFNEGINSFYKVGLAAQSQF